jgi:uncharacterized membrane protein (UPF0127 family)
VKLPVSLPIALLVLLVLAGILAAMLPSNQRREIIQNEFATVRIGDTTVRAEVASTSAAREQGLSGHLPLGTNEGMLFVFDWSDKYGFWMKDMLFAIDIIWIDEEGVVVTVAPSVGPESYPEVFYPSRAARYVLEVPAGFSKTHGIAEGTKVVVQ